MHPTLKHLIDTGIPVSKAQFHAAVNNADNTPENYFSETSEVPSRRVSMWWTPHTLVCFQKGKTRELYFGVPISTVIFATFKDSSEVYQAVEGSNIATDPLPKKKLGRPFKDKDA